MNDNDDPNARRVSHRTLALAGLVAVGLGAGAVYGIGFAAGNDGARSCSATPATLSELDAASKGEVAAVIVPKTAKPLPEMSFADADGQTRTLADWKGKIVLLNLWATWCVPCREEMPALDALQAEYGGDNFEVVPVNLDRGEGEKPRKFLEETGIRELKLYRDPKNAIFSTLKSRGQAFGLPTTILLDRAGCEIGHLPGPAEWSSEDGKELIRTAIDGAKSS